MVVCSNIHSAVVLPIRFATQVLSRLCLYAEVLSVADAISDSFTGLADSPDNDLGSLDGSDAGSASDSSSGGEDMLVFLLSLGA
jgi:hypothetical protein